MTLNLYLNTDMTECEMHDVAHGQVAVHTSKCPGESLVNEDAAAVIQVDDNSGVLIVADGVGGGKNGHIASQLAVKTLVKSIQKSADSQSSLRSGILDGIEQANKAILELGGGAATTLALLEINNSTVRPYHIGDSMIIAMGLQGKLKLQTVPHSPVGYAVEAGVLAEKDALLHEERHIVSNVLGSSEMHIELGPEITLAKNDTVILCSDGLFDNLTLSEIIQNGRKGPLKSASKTLAELSRDRMDNSSHPISKPDDLTLIAFRPKR